MDSPQLQIPGVTLGNVLGSGTVGTIYAARLSGSAERAVPTNAALPDLPANVAPDHWMETCASGSELAVKVLHESAAAEEQIRTRFKREIRILQRLDHPNIIHCYIGGEDRGKLYYVMDRIDGGTVGDLIEADGRIPWPIVVDIGVQVCSALQHAHNQGVVHRDLKPGNLFLTLIALVKLGDFGIARDLMASDISKVGQTVGTHAYMAPEQITADSELSGKADLYSLGCCLFEMLTGSKVFGASVGDQLLKHHLGSQPPLVKDMVGDCPDELSDLVATLLSKRPEDRPFNARSVQGVLLEIGEQHGLAEAKVAALPAGTRDTDQSNVLTGDELTARGRRMLQRQISMRHGRMPRPEVAWKRLAVVVIVIALISIAIALSSGAKGVPPTDAIPAANE